MLNEKLTLIPGRAVDSEARLYFRAQPNSNVTEISGELYGPQCEYARTLAATYNVSHADDPHGNSVLSSVVIPDPCFWTPALPFLYDLNLAVKLADGETLVEQRSIALKRFATDGKNWKLEGRRFVFRGAMVSDLSATVVTGAREVEAALIVQDPDKEIMIAASRQGVPFLVDACDAKDGVSRMCQRLSWYPAGVAVVASATQLSTMEAPPPAGVSIGLAIDSRSDEVEEDDFPFSFYAVELQSGERPPPWLITACKPAIAIRRGAEYADLAAARAACDRLQAELAPEFDLAGYFVAP